VFEVIGAADRVIRPADQIHATVLEPPQLLLHDAPASVRWKAA